MQKWMLLRGNLHVIVQCYMRQHFSDHYWLHEHAGGHASWREFTMRAVALVLDLAKAFERVSFFVVWVLATCFSFTGRSCQANDGQHLGGCYDCVGVCCVRRPTQSGLLLTGFAAAYHSLTFHVLERTYDAGSQKESNTYFVKELCADRMFRRCDQNRVNVRKKKKQRVSRQRVGESE